MLNLILLAAIMIDPVPPPPDTEPEMMPKDIERYYEHQGLPLSEWRPLNPVTRCPEYDRGMLLYFNPAGYVVGRYNFRNFKYERGYKYNGDFIRDGTVTTFRKRQQVTR